MKAFIAFYNWIVSQRTWELSPHVVSGRYCLVESNPKRKDRVRYLNENGIWGDYFCAQTFEDPHAAMEWAYKNYKGEPAEKV